MTDEPINLSAARAERTNDNAAWDLDTALLTLTKQRADGSLTAESALILLAHRDEYGRLLPGNIVTVRISMIEALGLVESSKIAMLQG